jgi:hypothetical protein
LELRVVIGEFKFEVQYFHALMYANNLVPHGLW